MIRDLHYYGSPSLRKIAVPIGEVNDEVKKLADDLIETMDSFNAIGLAATQVGIFLRIFVIRVEFVGKNGEFVKGIPRVYINPKITKASEEKETLSEACLSLPKLSVDVTRPITIHIEALDVDGNPITEVLEGFTARQFMHENDHLNGTLIIDRCPKEQRKDVLPILQKIKKNQKSLQK